MAFHLKTHFTHFAQMGNVGKTHFTHFPIGSG